MMKYEDKVKWLSGALVVLLAMWGLGEFLSPERVAAREQTGTLLASKADAVADIAIASGSSSLHLAKKSGLWSLVDGSDLLPVQSSRVEALISALAKSGRKMPAAKDKNSWKDLGLDEAAAKSLKISDASGKTLLDLSAGNRGPTGAGQYVRFAGSEASYLIDTDLSSWLVTDRGSWLDLRVWKTTLGSDAVEKFDVKSDIDFAAAATAATAANSANRKQAKPMHLAFDFQRQGDAWKDGAITPDPVAVESALRAALNLEAADLAAKAPSGAFDKVGAVITLTLGSAKTRVLEVGAPAGDGRWWVRATDGDQISPFAFQVSSWSLAGFVKDPSSFVKKAQ